MKSQAIGIFGEHVRLLERRKDIRDLHVKGGAIFFSHMGDYIRTIILMRLEIKKYDSISVLKILFYVLGIMQGYVLL